jgi:hypothetical protein
LKTSEKKWIHVSVFFMEKLGLQRSKFTTLLILNILTDVYFFNSCQYNLL